MASPLLKEAFPGGCYLGETPIKCSWTAAGCGAYDFKSFRELPERSKCHDSHRIYTGMCVDETLCTSNATNCLNPESYVISSPFCNIEYNFNARSKAGNFHLSGTCDMGGVVSCVYSAADCENGVFTKPGENDYSNTCTCDNTRVGACRNGNLYYCAVSRDGCAVGDEFIEWFNLGDVVDCRLCNDFAKEARKWPVPLDYERTPTKESKELDFALGFGFLFGVVISTFVACVFGRCYGGRSSKNGNKELDLGLETEMPTVA